MFQCVRTLFFCSRTSLLRRLSCIIASLVSMSFASLLRGPAAPPPTKRRQYKNDKCTVEAKLNFGERAATYLRSTCGQERADLILVNVARRANGSQPSPASEPMIIDLEGEDLKASRLPYGFWQGFMKDEMRMQYTKAKAMMFHRALQFYACRKMEGASTIAAMRGMRARNSCRSNEFPNDFLSTCILLLLVLL